MKRSLLAVVLCLSTLLAFAKGRNDSISFEQLEKKYPSSQYIVGTGQGASLANAQGAAKLSICQTLGETLKGQQVISQASSSDGSESSSMEINVDESVLFEHITGIQAKESWQTKGGDWISVCVLDKKEAAGYYQKAARENDGKISLLVSQAEKSSPSLESVELMEQVVGMAQENQYNLDLLRAISLNQYALTSMLYGSVQELRLKQNQLASSVTVKVSVQNDKDGSVYGALVSALTSRGITVADGNSLYSINATVSIEETPSLDSKNVYMRYAFDSPVVYADGSVAKPFNISGREGHLTAEQARQRCYSKICARIAEEF